MSRLALIPSEPLEETPCPGQQVEVRTYCDVQVIEDDIGRYTAHLACVQQHIDPAIVPS